MSKASVYSYTTLDWSRILTAEGCSERAVGYWVDGLYGKMAHWENHISPQVSMALKQKFDFSLPTIVHQLESTDGTVKFQVRFNDGMEVETVLIPFHRRRTVCLSTQVGCAMNCGFCYTGTQGLKRNLTSGEIVGQYVLASQWLKSHDPASPTPSIVFMGQGEPLHNADHVREAILVLNDPKLIGVGHRQMTLSTVGHLPGLEKIKDFPKINLALSLHSPFPEERNELIPLGVRYPLTQVMEAIDRLPLLKRQFITYEYLLIGDFNMSDRHAEGLYHLLSRRKAIINLIPFNPFPGSKWRRPSQEEVEVFKKKLVERKLRVMVRTTKGDDILAACGQLKINKLAREYGTTAR